VIEPIMSDKEGRAQEEHVPDGEVIYRAIRSDGDHALGMTSAELTWSGLAAGLSMGFSLAAEGVLRAHLPDAPWRPLVAKLGYTTGFLIVMLGRQQLFTEQTLTAMLSLFSVDRREGTIGNVARLWTIVLIANLVGTALFAAAAAWLPVFTPEVRDAFARIGHEALNPGFTANLVRAIYAGFLIATMVWLLPGSGESRIWIVIIIAWVVGIASLAHVIAGSSETLYVVFIGERAFTDYLINFLVPSVVGNSIGGVALVAALAHAQHAPAEAQ
jgi:formate/nitrite transporter FocA (FNT family)